MGFRNGTSVDVQSCENINYSYAAAVGDTWITEDFETNDTSCEPGSSNLISCVSSNLIHGFQKKLTLKFAWPL